MSTELYSLPVLAFGIRSLRPKPALASTPTRANDSASSPRPLPRTPLAQLPPQSTTQSEFSKPSATLSRSRWKNPSDPVSANADQMKLSAYPLPSLLDDLTLPRTVKSSSLILSTTPETILVTPRSLLPKTKLEKNGLRTDLFLLVDQQFQLAPTRSLRILQPPSSSPKKFSRAAQEPFPLLPKPSDQESSLTPSDHPLFLSHLIYRCLLSSRAVSFSDPFASCTLLLYLFFPFSISYVTIFRALSRDSLSPDLLAMSSHVDKNSWREGESRGESSIAKFRPKQF